MRLIREARRLECENQRRESRRSHLKKWLDMSRDEEDQCLEDQKQQSEASRAPFGLSVTRRATPVSPLAPSLKKSQSPLAVKWSSYIEAMGLKDNSGKHRRVRFVEKNAEEFERPQYTDEEKAKYHYSAEELNEMETLAKQFVHRESRFAGQPEDTILEQGFLSLPVNAPFFQNRRYYCLLRGHRLQMYSSAAHAAKNTGMKTQLTILRVQDCQALSMQKNSLESQIQEFGQTPKLLFSTPHPSRNEGEGKIEVATPDLLLSPRVVVPHIRRVSIPANSASDFRLQQRKEFAFSAFEDYTESEDETEDDLSPYQRTRHRYSLVCCQSSWNRLPKAIEGLSTHLWGSISSGKPPKNWRWTSRLRTKYSLSTSWSWKQISKCQLHKGEVTSTILSKDNSFLWTTSKDKTLKLSSTQDVAQYRDVSGNFALSCCDISPDESVVLVGSWDNSVYMHSTSTGLVLDKVFAHSDGISAIRVLQDRFVTSSWDSSIKLWRYTSRFIVATPIRIFLDCEESVLCLDVSRDGRFCAAGTRNGSVYLFNLSRAVFHSKIQASKHEGGISSIAFAQDNKSYVCATVQSELIQFNIRGEKLWSMDIRTAGQVRCFDSDGKYAVGGTTAGKILFWKLHEQAGTELVYEIPQAHDASISSLAVSSSGSIIVSGAVDGSVHVWKLQKKTPLPRTETSQLLSRQPTLHYGSIQTTSTSTSKIKTQRRSNFYIPNATAQLAEAECCLEF
ncbi:Multiple inositol polyphosphate phosphatase 1 [Phytophthora nicotianae]|uniref:Multiple inositol polyphosphate phosphatase 1 n=1 Tax=Phytophthora nicotianae TaxID=4792 RepID=A0A0W8DTV2_PHYNI|nr:Multiple inositol polyphosphate phosphatase 1 [Phytophthora nicotianae]